MSNIEKVINVKKLFKAERGTHTGTVRVQRDGKVFTRQQRVGKKPSGRTGTGKMDKFPESVKKEILDQRSYGESGAKIKEFIENMITQTRTGTPEQEKEISVINDKIITIRRQLNDKNITKEKENKLIQDRRDLAEKEGGLRREMKGEIKTSINGKSTGRNLIEEGLISESGKLTVTAQALTDWAKKQGVESRKTRTSGLSREKESHSDTKKELDRSTKKIAELEVRGKHANEEFKLLQRQKQESDKLKLEYAQKLRACLDRNK